MRWHLGAQRGGPREHRGQRRLDRRHELRELRVAGPDLGFGRTVVSEIEAPNMLGHLV